MITNIFEADSYSIRHVKTLIDIVALFMNNEKICKW